MQLTGGPPGFPNARVSPTSPEWGPRLGWTSFSCLTRRKANARESKGQVQIKLSRGSR